MLLLIDNYDSFTYNLAQYFGELGCQPIIKRNDEISPAEIADLAPQYICISPGPCTPREAGVSTEVIRRFGPDRRRVRREGGPRFSINARESINDQA